MDDVHPRFPAPEPVPAPPPQLAHLLINICRPSTLMRSSRANYGRSAARLEMDSESGVGCLTASSSRYPDNESGGFRDTQPRGGE